MLTDVYGRICQQKMIDVLEKSEIKLLRLSKQVTNNEYIITIIKDNRVMQVNNRFLFVRLKGPAVISQELLGPILFSYGERKPVNGGKK